MVLRSVPPSADIGSLRMWHVTLTMSGESQPIDHVRQALERLSHAHPFLLEARYGNDRAELRYWEEADDMDAAIAIASTMWESNERSSGLPGWDVVGLQVLDRHTYLRHEPLRVLPPEGRIAPF
jgi:hypothetical protein